MLSRRYAHIESNVVLSRDMITHNIENCENCKLMINRSQK